ncbi:MAG: tetratricopeptide repeat protein [Kiritimatiellae bacterium]|nr:tetratricopeptide repeat protein [Kiritimatiellia bacterium]MDD4735356.1 tetratricopeptide repeat protein [Kiritimatiellia bacterium]
MTRKSSHILLLLITLLTSAASALYAQQPTTIQVQAGPEEQFATARKAYDDGDITRAAALYENLLKQGFLHPEVYFNLGNACFRRGETGKAILNFKRALLLTPRDHDIKANLRFALENAGALAPKSNLLDTFSQQATLNEWLALALLCWWLLVAAYILRLLRPANAPLAHRLMLLFGVALLLTLSATLHQVRLQSEPEAVVTANGQSALSAPLSGSTPLFKLPEGSVVRLIDRSGEWMQIAAGPQTGWIQQDACAVVPHV